MNVNHFSFNLIITKVIINQQLFVCLFHFFCCLFVCVSFCLSVCLLACLGGVIVVVV